MQFQVASANAIMLYFGDVISLENSLKVQSAYEHLKQAKLEGVIDLVPSYTSLMVSYDLFVHDRLSIQTALSNLLKETQAISQRKQTKRVQIPVCYDLGLDLERIATLKELSTQDVIQLHTQQIYRVYTVGFAPGFAYLASVDERIASPRLETPRSMIPKGSVAIADTQTAVYPEASPGGWNIVGRTAVQMFDTSLERLCPVQMGDEVEFVAISKKEYLSQGGIL